MFIQVLISILFSLFSILFYRHHCWYSWLFLSSLLFSPLISLLFSFLQPLTVYYLPLLSQPHSLPPIPVYDHSVPPCPPSSLPCSDKVLTATHSGMAANKRAKQKVNLSWLSLNTHHPALCLVQESGTTHWSSHHRLHIIPQAECSLITHFCEYLIIRSLTLNSN